MFKNGFLKTKTSKICAAVVLALISIFAIASISLAIFNTANANITAPSLDVTKTAEWTDADKKNVKVSITADAYGKLDYSGESTPQILYVGTKSTCKNGSSEKQDATRLKNCITNLATRGDVDYYLSSATKGSSSRTGYSPGKYNTDSGTVKKNNTMSNISLTSDSCVLGGMIDNLYEALSKKEYDAVVLAFDGCYVADGYGQTGTYGTTTYDVYPKGVHEADLPGILQDYYANDKVVWLTEVVNQDFGGYSYFYPTNTYPIKSGQTNIKLNDDEYKALRAMVCPDKYDVSGIYKDKALPADRQTSFNSSTSGTTTFKPSEVETPQIIDDIFIEKYSLDFSDKLTDSFNIDITNTYVETSLNGQIWEKLNVVPDISGNQVTVKVEGLRKHRYIRLTINAINNARGFEGDPNDGDANITMKGERSTSIPKKIGIEKILDQSVHIKYRTENESTGTVSVTEEVASLTSDLAGSVAEPKENHEFINWTNSKGELVSTDAHLIPDKSKTGGVNVDDTYTAHFSPVALSVDKTAQWIDEDKGQVSIVANAAGKGQNYVPNVLFVGTLCDAHTMTKDTIELSLHELSKTSNVDYYLFNKGPLHEYDCAGSIKKDSGGLNNYEKQSLKLHKNNHHALGPFLDCLYNQLKLKGDKYYDFIVLEFDGTRVADKYNEENTSIAEGFYINPPTKYNEQDIVKLLTPYYSSDPEKKGINDPKKVIWVTDEVDSNYHPNYKYNTGSDRELDKNQYKSLLTLICPILYKDAQLKDYSDQMYRLPKSRQTNYKNTDKLTEFLSNAIDSIKLYKLNFNDTIHVDEGLSIVGDPELLSSSDGKDWVPYTGPATVDVDRAKGIVTAKVEGLTGHKYMKLVVNVEGKDGFTKVSKDGDPNNGEVEVSVETGGETYKKDASTEKPLDWPIVLHYESGDPDHGSVSDASEGAQTDTPPENLKGSKPQPVEGWDIAYWERKSDHEKIYDKSETFIPPQNEFGRYVEETYIAHFAVKVLKVDYDVIGDPDWGDPSYKLPDPDPNIPYNTENYKLAEGCTTEDASAKGVVGKWEFAGWFSDEERTQPIENNILPGPIQNDITVYGKWIFKPTYLDVKYYVEGDASYDIPGDSIKPEDASIYKYSDYDVELICGTQWHSSDGKDTGIKGAWTFKGWYDNPQYSGDPITNIKKVENNLNFYGKWTFTPDKFRVDYYITDDEMWGHPEDTATPIDASVDYGSSFTLTAPITTKCDYAYDTYGQKIDGSWSFTGWCPDQSCEEDPITKFTNITEDKRAYGKWEFLPIQWEVNYEVANDPSWGRPGDDGGDPSTDYVQDKDSYIVDASLSTNWTTHNGEEDGVRGKWEFFGWSEDSSSYMPIKESYEHVTENKNLYGKWVFTPITHNVIYSVESITPKWGIPEGKVAPKPVSVIDGSSYTLDASLSTTWTTSDGTDAGVKGVWKFTGWTSDSTLKTPVEEFSDIREDKHAYGVWEFIPKNWKINYVVVDDPSWGRPSDDGGDKDPYYVEDKSPYDVDASLSTQWKTHNGLSDGISGKWTFTGWSENEHIVTRFDSVTSDHTLYGKWKFSPDYHDVIYHVAADPSWGKIPEGKVAPEPVRVIDGSSYILDASLSTMWKTLDGTKDSVSGEWTFTGWCIDQSCEEEPITDFKNIREDKDVYGKWVFTPKYWIVDYTLAPDPSWGVPENKIPPDEASVMDKDPYTVAAKQTTNWTTWKGDASSIGGKWTFTGWSENSETYEPTRENYDHVTENKHLFGKWEFKPNYYNVIYHVEGDASYDIPGDSVTPEDASIFENLDYTVEKICGTEWVTSDGSSTGIDGAWKFNGWYDNPEYSGEQVSIINSVHQDLDFYGKWTFIPEKVRVDYYVTDDKQWGRPSDTTTPVDVDVDSGSSYTLDSPLTTNFEYALSENGLKVDGSWTFTGWCENQSCEEDPITEFTNIREHKRAYGKWEFSPKEWEVSYEVANDPSWGRPTDDGGDPSTDTVIDKDPYIVDGSLSTNWTTHNGKEDGISGTWTFVGWSENKSSYETLVTEYEQVTENKHLYGKWTFEPDYHEVAYHVAADSSWGIPEEKVAPEPGSVIDGGTYVLDASLSTSWTTHNGEKDGIKGVWSFTGWCKDQSCEDYPITELTNIRQPENVYGKWEFSPQQWTIKYHVTEDPVWYRPGDDGGNPPSSIVNDKDPYTVDASLSTTWKTHNGKDDGIKGKWTFTGWSDNANTYSPTVYSYASITSDTTLYGKWEFKPDAPDVHNVIFDLQGHEVPGPKDQSVVDGSYAIRPETDPSDVGYTFEGWYDDASCSEGHEFKFETTPIFKDTIIYAKWNELDKIPIYYVAETGGSVDPSSESLYPYDPAHGSTATAKVGYEFEKWTNEDGETVGTMAKYVPDGPPEGGWKTRTFTAHFVLKTQITKDVNKTEANAGDILTYTINVLNESSTQISMASVSDIVPDGLIDIVVDQSGSYNPENREIVWDNLNIAAKSHISLSFNAKIPENITEDKNYENKAYFNFGDGQIIESEPVETIAHPQTTSILVHKIWTDTDNDHDSIYVNLYRDTMYSDPIESFSISKNDVVEGVSWSKKTADHAVYDDQGKLITYIIREVDKDNNPVDEQHIMRVDDKHSYTVGYAYTDAPGGKRVSASITNSYIVTNNDLKITKTTKVDRALPGQEIPYDIVVENKAIGGSAKNVNIEDVLPEGLIFVSADGGGKYDAKNRKVNWTIAEISKEKPVALHLVCKVPEDAKTAVYANTVTILGYDVPKLPDQSAPKDIIDPIPLTTLGVKISKTILRDNADYIYTNEEPGNKAVLSYYCFKYKADELYNPVITDVLPFGIEPDIDASDYKPEEWSEPDPSSGRYTFTRHLDQPLTEDKTQVLVSVKLFDKFDKDTSLVSNANLDTTIAQDPRSQKLSAISNPTEMVIVVPKEPIKPDKPAITEVKDIQVTKVWSDDAVAHTTDSVEVTLYQDGKPYLIPQVLNAANKWTYTWTKLPVLRDEGDKKVQIVYEVKETKGKSGYSESYDVDAYGNTKVTNTKQDVPPRPSPTPSPDQKISPTKADEVYSLTQTNDIISLLAILGLVFAVMFFGSVIYRKKLGNN